MTLFHLPNAVNPKTWTCGEVIYDNVFDFDQLKEVVALLADRAEDKVQYEIVKFIAPHLETL